MNIRSEYYGLETDEAGLNGTGLAIYYPEKRNEKSEIGLITMHGANFLSFKPMMEMAHYGYITAGINPCGRDVQDLMHSMNVSLNFMKEKTGIKKVILMGHSQGCCILSLYQYLAENGNDRFKNQDRIVPFPDIEKLTPADGVMLLDGNYGIMSMLALDPAVRNLSNGFARIPELDIFNPENGYRPGSSEYTPEFISRFQKAQLRMYRDLINYCLERDEAIRKGRGAYLDDEPLIIPGGAGGSSNNKPFCMDTRLLGRTSQKRNLLHADGTMTNEIVYTCRKPVDSVSSVFLHGGAIQTTVKNFLKQEMRFADDFGYNECTIWGIDEDFVYYSTRENVKHIRVPILMEGNTASHEFINMEITYENAVSEDKEFFLSEGACHGFDPVSEKYEGILGAACDQFDRWLSKEGRFI